MDRRAFITGAAALVAAPRALADPGRREVALVTADEEARLVAVDLGSGRIRRYVPTLRKPRSIEAGGPAGRVPHPRAGHASISPTGRLLWVALGAKGGGVAIVDVSKRARPRLLGGLRPPFLAHDVGWAPGGRRVWVSSGDRDEVAVYAARSGRLLERLAADEPPQHFTFRGDQVYV